MMPANHRALIRRAIVRVLKENPETSVLLKGGVYPNRMEHWLDDELPAAGVYTLSEEILESDISPDPLERRVALTLELLARMTAAIDDTLDELTQGAENALTLEAIGAAMTAIVNDLRAAAGLPPLPPVTINGIPRSSAVDTLLVLKFTGVELGIAVDGDRQIGVAAMNYDLEYALPPDWPPLAEFILGIAKWDTQPADGVIEMTSRVKFDT